MPGSQRTGSVALLGRKGEAAGKKPPRMAPDEKRLAREVLREQVRRVGRPGDLVQPERTGAHLLLDPQLAHRKMPHPADSRPAADADRSAGVGVHPDAGGEAEIAGQALKPQSLAGRLDDPD